MSSFCDVGRRRQERERAPRELVPALHHVPREVREEGVDVLRRASAVVDRVRVLVEIHHQQGQGARGGNGGRGNAAFATPSRRTPDFAKPGGNAQERTIRLELKLLADVGLVGFPNAGKSTLISRISRARPKIADYPFTTLTPNLGVVSVDVARSYVVADMPGLIEGAADGAGLGHRFLRHIERTALFVFLITQDLAPGRDPIADYRALLHELGRYDADLLARPKLVALSQCDRPDVLEQLDAVRAALGEDVRVFPISAVTGVGLDALHKAIADHLTQSGRWGEVDGW